VLSEPGSEAGVAGAPRRPAQARPAPRQRQPLTLSANEPREAVGAFAGAATGRAERQAAGPFAPKPARTGGDDVVKTVRHEGPKVGRNDPCPCGSGKKYKKCHGASVS
jgi:preprotein translocase subunit SecA